MQNITLENLSKAWGFRSLQYVQASVKNMEEYLAINERKKPSKALTQIQTSYRPDINTMSELNAVDSSYYQSLIGILRWMVEIGRVYVCLGVSMLSSHIAFPREGHLQQLFHMFAYLKRNHNSEMIFDPSDPVID